MSRDTSAFSSFLWNFSLRVVVIHFLPSCGISRCSLFLLCFRSVLVSVRQLRFSGARSGLAPPGVCTSDVLLACTSFLPFHFIQVDVLFSPFSSHGVVITCVSIISLSITGISVYRIPQGVAPPVSISDSSLTEEDCACKCPSCILGVSVVLFRSSHIYHCAHDGRIPWYYLYSWVYSFLCF